MKRSIFMKNKFSFLYEIYIKIKYGFIGINRTIYNFTVHILNTRASYIQQVRLS